MAEKTTNGRELPFCEKVCGMQTRIRAPKSKRAKMYSYRSCEDILEAAKPLLAEYGLILTLSDEPVVVEGWRYIKATATLSDGKDGRLSASAYAREDESTQGMARAQLTGSTSSYARKYALNGLLCIDDNKDIDDESVRQNLTSQKPQNAPAQEITEEYVWAAIEEVNAAKDAAELKATNTKYWSALSKNPAYVAAVWESPYSPDCEAKRRYLDSRKAAEKSAKTKARKRQEGGEQ